MSRTDAMLITDVFDDDLWAILASLLRIEDTGRVACTCRAWRRIVSLPSIDHCIARVYATRVLGDAAFLGNAVFQPIGTRSLPTYRQEIEHIEQFKRTGGRQRLAACELYKLWPLLDTLDPCSPRRPTCCGTTPIVRGCPG
jgi:hypothetical protein